MKKGIISVLSTLAGAAAGAVTAGKILSKETAKNQKMSEKHLALFLMMNQWVAVKQQGKSISNYLEENGYKFIAIYGMSYAGERLVEELQQSNISIKYGIDKNYQSIYTDIDVLSMEDALPEVDAVIVTPIFFFDEIENNLSKKLNCPIFSLEDILYEV